MIITFWYLAPLVLLYLLARGITRLVVPYKNPSGDARKGAPDPPPEYEQSEESTGKRGDWGFDTARHLPNNSRWPWCLKVSWNKDAWQFSRSHNRWVTYVSNHPYWYDSKWRRLTPL